MQAFLFGGAEEDRTPDLCIANAALSQLSYFPVFGPLRLGATGNEIIRAKARAFKRDLHGADYTPGLEAQ